MIYAWGFPCTKNEGNDVYDGERVPEISHADLPGAPFIYMVQL